MARRHASLVPLSRDHYQGLLMAVRLQQGGNALLHLWSHDPQWQAKTLCEFFDKELVGHFDQEELILFPGVRKYLGTDAAVIDDLVSQHREMQSLIARYFRKPAVVGLEDHLKEFGKLLEKHIRLEDRTLFPLIEEKVPADVLGEVGKDLGVDIL